MIVVKLADNANEYTTLFCQVGDNLEMFNSVDFIFNPIGNRACAKSKD